MKRLFFVFVFIFGLLSISYCQTAKEKMDDAMGRAYKAATEKKLEEAKEWFNKGMQYAQEANFWPGLIDSGYGLSTLGLPEEAKTAFDSASQIIQNERDWHGAVALGYAYASLPSKMNTIESATQIWTKAKEWANEKNDWCGLLEAGRGFISILKNDKAEESFDLAKNIVKEIPTEQAIKALVQAYRKIGKEDKALECAGYRTRTETTPPGWTPTAGESVREPKTVSPAIQQAQRASADKDIERKQQWEEEQARLKYEEKLQKEQLSYQAYRDYLRYYSYPYYGIYTGIIVNDDDYYIYSWTTQPVWVIRTNDEICNWALWNLSRYTYVDGIYIAVDIY